MFDFISGPDPTEFDIGCLPLSVGGYKYRARMDKPDSKKVLWANVQTLMTHHFGRQNLGLVASRGEFSPANMTRIAAAETDVGIELLEKIAKVFKIEAWQLLAPDLGAHLHTVKGAQILPAYVPPAGVVVERLPTAQSPPPSVGAKSIKSGKLASPHRVIAGPHIKPAKSKDANKTNKPKR